jgi:dienelactone hydrolase
MAERDLTYGVDLRFDVYRPEAAGPHPLVVLLPGRSGGKSILSTLAGSLAARGVVVMVPDYRARDDQPTPLSDVRCAIDTAASLAPTWGADSNRLVLAGVTWGAVAAIGEGAAASPWATTEAASGSCPGIAAQPRPPARGIVGIVGDYEFYGSPGSGNDGFATFSPYSQLAGSSPVPLYLIHGAPDRLTLDPGVSSRLADAAKAAGWTVDVQLVPTPNLALSGLGFDEATSALAIVHPDAALPGMEPVITAVLAAAAGA